MKILKKHNAATIYIERNPGANAKFYAKIDDVMLDTPFESQSDAEDFVDNWMGTDDSTDPSQDERIVDSGFVTVYAPKK